ncbi:hypothetical protein AQJ30_15725 [Streptomyces longwoodensis]|uniref:Uncharacterized protein n=1 Tax=Streptomyces longwoodensis TaxID=68231 RepID=A0A101QX69_9ACTN|nr:hypothetical protein [Streptomyces longwoodensis]KUN37732.1 hypothetical protein AQJ30_15725 [Streptomyces longwoodensis]
MSKSSGAPRAREEEPAGSGQVSDEIHAKAAELAGELQRRASGAPYSEAELAAFVRERTEAQGAVFYAEVLDLFPDVQAGDTAAGYAARAVKAVRG